MDMTCTRRHLIAAVWALGLAGAAWGQEAGFAAMAEKADAVVSAYAAQGEFSGVAAIAKDGKLVFAKGYGMANYEWGVPNTVEAKFRIGSVSKQFGAAAILKLQEEGKLKVDDAACGYLPDCPERWRRITIHQLLTHTSGIPNVTNLPAYEGMKHLPSRYEEQVKAVWELPLDFDPGTQFAYSNTGYIMLGQVIEKASGMKWESYLEKALFGPAGMKDTMAGSNSLVVAKQAYGYRGNAGKPTQAEYVSMAIPNVAGAVVSTVGDLVKWDRALAGTAVLSAESKARLWKVEKSGYAYGWGVAQFEGKEMQAHSGGIEGFSAQYARIPAEGLAVVVLSNFEDGKTGPIRSALVRLALGKEVAVPKAAPVVELSERELEEYVGKYEIAPTFAIEVTREWSMLMAQATGQDRFPVFAMRKDAFRYRVVEAELEFKREEGKVTGLVLKQAGREIPGRRVR